MKKTTTLIKAIMEDEYLPKGRIEDKYTGEKKIIMGTHHLIPRIK